MNAAKCNELKHKIIWTLMTSWRTTQTIYWQLSSATNNWKHLAQVTEPFKNLYPEKSGEKLPSHSVWSLQIRTTICLAVCQLCLISITRNNSSGAVYGKGFWYLKSMSKNVIYNTILTKYTFIPLEPVWDPVRRWGMPDLSLTKM